MPYGVCKICGCTDTDPCHNPTHGNCWWVDDTHELCSHCADKEIADDPATQHCINSKGFDPYQGVERKDLASLGCPFPDEDGEMCSECSHYNSSSVFTGECDLGIRIDNGGLNMNKPILDACCGGKMFYFDKNDPRVLFQDIRCIETKLKDRDKLRPFAVSPDVQADFTSMPYPDGLFRMVVFDPPHLKYTGSKKEVKNWQMVKYGWIPAHGWQDVIRQGFAECFRVLEDGGFLIFKWNETDIKVSEILKLTPYKPVFGHISGKRSNTHWICFMKDINDKED